MILKKDIAEFLKNETKIIHYNNGLRELQKSGVIDLMRRIGTPRVLFGETSSAMAHEGAWAAGYQAALENLVNFLDMFTPEQMEKAEKLGAPDFDGTEAALRRGDLRPEDLKGE